MTTFFSTENPINDTSKKFIEEYKKEYNKEPSAVAALAFDAYLVIRNAMEKTKSTDGGDPAEVPVHAEGLRGAPPATKIDDFFA